MGKGESTIKLRTIAAARLMSYCRGPLKIHTTLLTLARLLVSCSLPEERDPRVRAC